MKNQQKLVKSVATREYRLTINIFIVLTSVYTLYVDFTIGGKFLIANDEGTC